MSVDANKVALAGNAGPLALILPSHLGSTMERWLQPAIHAG